MERGRVLTLQPGKSSSGPRTFRFGSVESFIGPGGSIFKLMVCLWRRPKMEAGGSVTGPGVLSLSPEYRGSSRKPKFMPT